MSEMHNKRSLSPASNEDEQVTKRQCGKEIAARTSQGCLHCGSPFHKSAVCINLCTRCQSVHDKTNCPSMKARNSVSGVSTADVLVGSSDEEPALQAPAFSAASCAVTVTAGGGGGAGAGGSTSHLLAHSPEPSPHDEAISQSSGVMPKDDEDGTATPPNPGSGFTNYAPPRPHSPKPILRGSAATAAVVPHVSPMVEGNTCLTDEHSNPFMPPALLKQLQATQKKSNLHGDDSTQNEVVAAAADELLEPGELYEPPSDIRGLPTLQPWFSTLSGGHTPSDGPAISSGLAISGGPAINATAGINPERAAMIAATAEAQPPRAELKFDARLGPTSSGMNMVPLGRKRDIGGPSIPQSVGDSQLSDTSTYINSDNPQYETIPGQQVPATYFTPSHPMPVYPTPSNFTQPYFAPTYSMAYGYNQGPYQTQYQPYTYDGVPLQDLQHPILHNSGGATPFEKSHAGIYARAIDYMAEAKRTQYETRRNGNNGRGHFKNKQARAQTNEQRLVRRNTIFNNVKYLVRYAVKDAHYVDTLSPATHKTINEALNILKPLIRQPSLTIGGNTGKNGSSGTAAQDPMDENDDDDDDDEDRFVVIKTE